MDSNILAPAAVLVVWSLIMLMWAALTRFPAMKAAGIVPQNNPPGGRGQDLDPLLPPSVSWKSHNYTHLMEQPTLFYATVVILFLVSQNTDTNVMLAWAYTLIRIVHSIWQATVNTIIPVRFGLFLLSTICLFALAINAVRATLGA